MLEIKTQGIDELSRNFRQIEKKVSNHKVLYKRIGIKILKWVDDNFKAEGKEKKWDSLKPRTIAARRKGTSKILQDQGAKGLKGSFTFKVDNRSVRIGSDKFYSVFHEEGGKKTYPITPKKKMWLLFGVTPAERAHLAKGQGSKAEKNKAIFSKGVEHPPLPKRKMLPSKELGLKIAIEVTENFIKEAIK